MGILHRALARSVADVWDTETRMFHALGLVRRPVAVQWLVTAACDMKCPHCYSAAGKRGPAELTTEEAKTLVIDPLAELGCGLLVLAGGELLLRDDVFELVDYANRRGLAWAMHTHGMHVPRFASLFRRHPPALAAISLDGDRSFHDAFRGRVGSFDAALEAAAVLAEAGCQEVVLGTTVTRENADRVADLFPTVVQSRAHSWGLHLFAPEGRGHQHRDLFPTPGQLRRVASFARRRRSQFPIELCNEWGSAGQDDIYYRDQPFTCGAGTTSFVISADGSVLPCTTTDPRESVGNVRQTPLLTLWRDQFRGFRSGGCTERGECWLQTRNGVRCAEDAFGPRSLPPLWIEQLPSTGQRRRRKGAGLAGRGVSMAVQATAAGLVFLQGCSQPARHSPHGTDRHTRESRQRPNGGTRPTQGRHWGASFLSDDTFPAALAEDPVTQVVSRNPRSEWRRLEQGLLECEASFGNCEQARELLPLLMLAPDDMQPFARHIDALAGEGTHSVERALALLALAERRPAYSATFAAHLWRSVRGVAVQDRPASRARARLYGRLRRHHRVVDALTQAQASAPVVPRPWLKKSMPPVTHVDIPESLIPRARALYPNASATTWDTLVTAVTVRGGDVELARDGHTTTVRAGETVHFGRLDVLWCPEARTLVAAGGQALHVPASTEVTLFELHRFLAPSDRAALVEKVEQAASGQADALDDVEASLGLAHDLVRQRAQTTSGSSPLRTLLVAFDE